MLRPSVETLFERFRNGDIAALGSVFDRTAPELMALARHLSRDQASAEDLVQGTFLAAIESARSWDARQPLVPWLVGILANLARMERRREARRVPPERVAAGSAEDPAVACETRELGESLERTVRALPEPYRAVLVLHLLHGLSAGEIADALGAPAGTVRSQVTRGLELLRRALPVGLTATAVAVVTSPAALAAMRARLIERAAEVCGVAASGVGSMSVLVLGGLAMKTKNVVLMLGALVLAGTGAWLGLSRDPVASQVSRSPDASVAAGSRPDAAPDAEPVPATSATTTPDLVRMPASTDTATGSLRVRVRWHDGTPAAGVVVSLEPKDIEGAKLWRRWRTADAAGIVEFTGIPQCSADVAALNGGKTSASIQAGAVSEALLDVPRGVDVKGRVVAIGSRRPIAGASVGLVSWPDAREVARTDEQGRFTLRSVDWLGPSRTKRFGPRLQVQAWAAGYEASLSWLLDRVATDPGFELEIPLRVGGGTITGTVRDEAGRPVPDALVLCGPTQVHMVPSANNEKPVVGPRAPRQTSSDAEGEFVLSSVPAGTEEDHLWVTAAGFARWCTRVRVLRDRAARVEVTLERGVILRGTVRGPGGLPVAGWLVEAIDRLSAPELIQDQRPDVVATTLRTPADGRFTFPFLAAGRIEVRVRAAERKQPVLAAYRAFEAAPGSVLEWDAVLEKRSIQGRVVDDIGQPLAGCAVSASAGCRTPWLEGSVTDGNGLFTLAPCADVPHVVKCSVRGAQVLEQSGVVPGSGLLTLVVSSTRLPSAKVTGVVRDVEGSELGGIRVSLLDDGGRSIDVEVGAGGRFESRLLLPGGYRVEASHAKRGTLALGRHELRAGQVLDLGTASFAKPGALELTVVDARGEPWSGRLIVSRVSDASCHWLMVRGGKARVAALAPGSYAFSGGSSPPLCFAAPPVEVLAGETTLARVEECAGGWRKLRFPTKGRVPLAIWATIRDTTGQVRQPVPLVLPATEHIIGQVWQLTSFNFWQDADSDHDVLLPLGSYVLEARLADGRTATTPFEVTAAEAPPVAVRLP